jgi:predicted nucleic acid-binding protein
MNPPSYLLDKSFLIALADVDDPNHNEAKDLYRTLIDDFVAQRCLLTARSDHLAAIANPQLFAAVDKLHPARQHRNAAAKMVDVSGIDMELAITLVLIQRYRIRKVAAFDDRFAGYDIELIEPAATPTTDSERVEN